MKTDGPQSDALVFFGATDTIVQPALVSGCDVPHLSGHS